MKDLDELEELRIIPISKGRPILKFGLPVKSEIKKLAETHLLELYKEMKNAKEVRKLAKQESMDSNNPRINPREKVNPLIF